MTQIISRRTFLKQLSGCVASAALYNALKPAFVLAEAAPGPIKNVIEIFCYGGYDSRYLFPYYSGPVDKELRNLRPNISVPVISATPTDALINYARLKQGQRLNPIGFHPKFKEMLDSVTAAGAGISLIDQFGITKNGSFSHEVAQKQFRSGLSVTSGSVSQGYIGRLLDATGLPGMAVWSFGLDSEPTYMNTLGQNRPMIVSGLSSLNFVDRNFPSEAGGFSCAGVQGANCSGAGDWQTSGADDTVFARSIIRRLYDSKNEEMPLGEAANAALKGAFDLVPVAQSINAEQVDVVQFRPADKQGSAHEFSNRLVDVARTLKFLNSGKSQADVRASTKILALGLSGWDSHAYQTNVSSNIEILSAGLKGLVYYLNSWELLQSTVIVVYSEFSRTTRQNGSFGTDHAQAGTAMVIGGGNLVASSVFGPDPDVSEAINKNFFTPQVAVTGALRQIYGRAGLSGDQLNRVFPERMPNELVLPFLI